MLVCNLSNKTDKQASIVFSSVLFLFCFFFFYNFFGVRNEFFSTQRNKKKLLKNKTKIDLIMGVNICITKQQQ